ncbi:hypothetical protein H9Q09_00800 [Aurantimonas sp. DM33-3]|nr:hypothetical protein [Aurantimonas sp. DM33-3]
MRCPDCPHLFVGQTDPRTEIREICCANENRMVEDSPRNMMVDDVQTPETAPLNRAARRRGEKQRRRT